MYAEFTDNLVTGNEMIDSQQDVYKRQLKIHTQHFYIYDIPYMYDLQRVFDILFVGDLGNMDQSVLVHSDIHKHPKIYDIPDRALQYHALFQILHIQHICPQDRPRHFFSWIASRLFQLLYNIPQGDLSRLQFLRKLMIVPDRKRQAFQIAFPDILRRKALFL